MIGKEIQSFALKNAPRFSRFLTLLVRGAILHFFFLQEKIVQWRAIFCWIFWIFSEGTFLSESTLVFTY